MKERRKGDGKKERMNRSMDQAMNKINHHKPSTSVLSCTGRTE